MALDVPREQLVDDATIMRPNPGHGKSPSGQVYVD
jgi:hypothetical protein